MSMKMNIINHAGVKFSSPQIKMRFQKKIEYLTQWKIVGNSEVHTDEYLTSWKVSGNSVVDNNTILSCGDLGQDGKYHVKISNGATVFDIPLDAPLRKVNDVADTIEFPSNIEGKALVTRNLNAKNYNSLTAIKMDSENKICHLSHALPYDSFGYTESMDTNMIFLCNKLNSYSLYYGRRVDFGIIPFYRGIFIRNASIEQTVEAYQEYLNGLGAIDVIYKLATPTTELIDVSPFPVSPTDTYTSANVVPFSAFEYTENKEIWSCGEYNATDGKYHILVQPQGGSIADIALDEPLRKVNNVADTIEFPSETEGKALVTRNLAIAWWKDMNIIYQLINNQQVSDYERFLTTSLNKVIGNTSGTNTNICLSANYEQHDAPVSLTRVKDFCMCVYDKNVYIRDIDCHSKADFKAKNENNYFFYVLATPTTELVDAPQIEEADSYSMVISQGAKTVSWSSFSTD